MLTHTRECTHAYQYRNNDDLPIDYTMHVYRSYPEELVLTKRILHLYRHKIWKFRVSHWCFHFGSTSFHRSRQAVNNDMANVIIKFDLYIVNTNTTCLWRVHVAASSIFSSRHTVQDECVRHEIWATRLISPVYLSDELRRAFK
jgi:hypothetical protein